MLTAKGIKGLGVFFRFTRLVKSLPFIWDVETNILSVKYTGWSFFIWLFLSAVEAANAIRSLIDFLFCVIYPDSEYYISHMLLGLHLVFATGQFLGALFAWNLLFRLKENVACYNQLLRTNQIIWDKFRAEKTVRNKLDSKRVYLWTNKLMHGLVPWLVCTFFFNSSFVLFDSQHRQWGWHLLSSSRTLGFPLVLWSLCEGYLFNMVYSLVALYFFIFPVVFTQNINYWLEFLQELSSAKHGNHSTAKEIEAYRSLAALMSLYNDTQSEYAWPIFIGANIHFHVMCNFICIKFSHTMNFAGLVFLGSWSLAYLMIDYFAYPIGGSVYERSHDLLRNWKQQLRSAVGVRQVKALRPVAVRIGGMFSMSNTTPLQVMHITANVTLNVLLLN